MDELVVAQAVLSQAVEPLDLDKIVVQHPLTASMTHEQIQTLKRTLFGEATTLAEVRTLALRLQGEKTQKLLESARRDQFGELAQSEPFQALRAYASRGAIKQGIEEANRDVEMIDAEVSRVFDNAEAVGAPEEPEGATEEPEKPTGSPASASGPAEPAEPEKPEKKQEDVEMAEPESEEVPEVPEPATAEATETDKSESTEPPVEAAEAKQAEEKEVGEVFEEAVAEADAQDVAQAEKESENAEAEPESLREIEVIQVTDEPDIVDMDNILDKETTEEPESKAAEAEGGKEEPEEVNPEETEEAEVEELEEVPEVPETKGKPKTESSDPKEETESPRSRSNSPAAPKRKADTKDSPREITPPPKRAKARRLTARTTNWLQKFVFQQEYELEDPEIVLQALAPIEIEDRVLDEEIDNPTDLLLAIYKTFADYSMANSDPEPLAFPIEKVDTFANTYKDVLN